MSAELDREWKRAAAQYRREVNATIIMLAIAFMCFGGLITYAVMVHHADTEKQRGEK